MTDFEQFWSIYPKKVARLAAKKAFLRLTPEQQSKAVESIPAHCRYWAETSSPQYIPHASTFLHGERFEDELPEIVQNGAEWWRSGEGIMRKGRELGIVPKPGESTADYAARIREKA